MAKDRILVMSVDRDNDIGRKTDIKGPVIGRQKVLDTAMKLAVSDPEDSDSNAIFGAVKLFDELKDKYESEIAVVTGHKNRGIDADREISRQLTDILRKRNTDFVVLVTDGVDDEHVIPIIQSHVPILSVKRIIVRQAEKLESGYYKIKDFIKESIDNPKFARVVFGLPAIALLLYALMGDTGWRFIVGVVGAYLFIKGFKLEDYVMAAFVELRESFTGRRFSFFMYVVAIAVSGLAIYRGYNSVTEFMNVGLFEAAAAFLLSSIYFFWISGTIAWLGNKVRMQEKRVSRIASVPIFGLAASMIIYEASELVLNPDISSFNFIITLALGFVLAFVALAVETKD